MSQVAITRYLIVRDGKTEHLLRLVNGSAHSIMSGDKRLSLYEALVADAGLSLVQLDVAGAAAPNVAQIIAVPAERSTRLRGSSKGGVCSFCHRERIKDGRTASGAQRWRCPEPHNQRQENRGARAVRRGSGKAKRLGPVARMKAFQNNPKCPNCDKPMNVAGRHKGITYYKCKHGCPKPARREGWSSLNLPSTDGQARNLEMMVRKRVEACNHHDLAIRDDVVQEIMLDLESQKLSLNDLDTDRIRGYIRSQQRLRSNPHRYISIDAPAGNSSRPFAEVMEG